MPRVFTGKYVVCLAGHTSGWISGLISASEDVGALYTVQWYIHR